MERYIETLPEGYDTVVDEEGSNVSAGEKQLLAIARAFLANPSRLILYEATSSVDTRTERGASGRWPSSGRTGPASPSNFTSPDAARTHCPRGSHKRSTDNRNWLCLERAQVDRNNRLLWRGRLRVESPGTVAEQLAPAMRNAQDGAKLFDSEVTRKNRAK